jgi:hypothetical protein
MLFTPRNLKTTEIVEDERPYAGLLQFACFSEIADSTDRTWWRHDLALAFLGRPAGGSIVQGAWHTERTAELPRGWDNEVGADFGVIYTAQWTPHYMTSGTDTINVDAIPTLRAQLGTLLDNLQAELLVRVGWMPLPFTDSSATKGGFLFGRYEAKRVLYDATLQGGMLNNALCTDGCKFRSPHVLRADDIEPLVETTEVGGTAMFGTIRISISFYSQTPEVRNPQDAGLHRWSRIRVDRLF